MAKRRKHGDGSVRLRKDGRWEGRYVVGRDEKGLPNHQKRFGKNQSGVCGKAGSAAGKSPGACARSAKSQGFCLVTG